MCFFQTPIRNFGHKPSCTIPIPLKNTKRLFNSLHGLLFLKMLPKKRDKAKWISSMSSASIAISSGSVVKTSLEWSTTMESRFFRKPPPSCPASPMKVTSKGRLILALNRGENKRDYFFKLPSSIQLKLTRKLDL